MRKKTIILASALTLVAIAATINRAMIKKEIHCAIPGATPLSPSKLADLIWEKGQSSAEFKKLLTEDFNITSKQQLKEKDCLELVPLYKASQAAK